MPAQIQCRKECGNEHDRDHQQGREQAPGFFQGNLGRGAVHIRQFLARTVPAAGHVHVQVRILAQQQALEQHMRRSPGRELPGAGVKGQGIDHAGVHRCTPDKSGFAGCDHRRGAFSGIQRQLPVQGRVRQGKGAEQGRCRIGLHGCAGGKPGHGLKERPRKRAAGPAREQHKPAAADPFLQHRLLFSGHRGQVRAVHHQHAEG